MRLVSKAFEEGDSIPMEYTCDGRDTHPALTISNVPGEAKSLALIVDDPDAPMGLWVHWVVWNISPDTREIQEGIVPLGAEQGLTSSGERKYHGPCPPTRSASLDDVGGPDREHRYFFRLYALDTRLDLDSLQTGKEELKDALHGHALAQAELMGRYARSSQSEPI